MLTLTEIIKKISQETEKTEEEVNKLIKEKQEELSGLVSKEGAAYIVGRELGVQLIKENKRRLRIKNLVSGLRSVDLVARVVKIFEARNFEVKGRKGRVANILLGDETGTARLSLWDDEIKLVEENKIKEGDIVELKGGYVKIDNRGNPELRIGRGSLNVSEEDFDIPDVNELRGYSIPARKKIKDFKENEFEETKACIVQIFERNPFFEVCPQCESRLKISDEKWKCEQHGEVKPAYQMVVSGFIDDGTGTIRAVFFRELAEKIFGKSTDELRQLVEKESNLGAIYNNIPALGKDFIIKGRVKRNEFTENLEIIVNDMQEIDPKKETEKILRDLENKGTK
jgi:replication factor A1